MARENSRRSVRATSPLPALSGTARSRSLAPEISQRSLSAPGSAQRLAAALHSRHGDVGRKRFSDARPLHQPARRMSSTAGPHGRRLEELLRMRRNGSARKMSRNVSMAPRRRHGLSDSGAQPVPGARGESSDQREDLKERSEEHTSELQSRRE